VLAKLLLGKPSADLIYSEIDQKVSKLNDRGGAVNIRAILVGNDPASIAYLNIKEKRCSEHNIDYKIDRFDENTTTEQIIEHINKLNVDKPVTGIIVQLPLPKQIDFISVLKSINTKKDIDAFHFVLDQNPSFATIPPTPKGMTEILVHNHIEIYQKNVVVVGNGLLVGQPLFRLLGALDCSLSQIDDLSPESKQILKSADIVFSGVGKANIIQPDLLKPGCVIVDAGYEKVDGVVCGDADPRCAEVASYMTPPIGGIGPLTVANLLLNAVELANKQITNYQ